MFSLLLWLCTALIQVQLSFATEAKPIISVGSELDFFPYAYINNQGQPDGFSVDLIKSIAKTMDLDIEIKGAPWNTVWTELVQGKIDVLPLVGKVPNRATLIEFGAPHSGISDGFYVRTGSAPLATFSEAQGKEIVVMKSDVAHHKLLENRFKGKIITVKTITEGLRMVAAGQHDAFLGPMLMANLAIKEHNIQGIESKNPVEDYLRIQAFAVKKGDFELLQTLNRGLVIIRSNGEYTRIHNKWLSRLSDELPKKQPDILPPLIALIFLTTVFVVRRRPPLASTL